ncbi:hypothetical protein OPKNFCMD_0233 [Methylobacterium crusticola]|uniref:Methyltransferase domain-containing protein n=1 Tax=Methylobacterium crusticola TaxID=1697972 RepID=A0ABQ4QRL1_9HYPH|nr:class I SAM-dependent methyltransferase [Methylobacterium crusticola]GJD47525.1 hypothetical protein OPKNFCMD_0233 [Methylobacterium crusticola]
MSTDQEAVFRAGEGDAWYRRNAAALRDRDDPVMQVLRGLDRRDRIRSVADLGCSNGWRLAALRPDLPAARRLAGCDPSGAAVAAGTEAWPDLELQVGSLARVPFAGAFDLVLVSFVFYLVDRPGLARAVAEVDRVVDAGGVLVLADFCADAPFAVPYHHRRDVALLSHKADHAAPFRALGYRETFRLEYDHDCPRLPGLVSTQVPDRMNRSAVAVLVKAAVG